MKRLKHIAEYAGLRALLGLFAFLPPERASAAGGALFRTLGPHMGISRVGRRNIARAFPGWPQERVEATLRGMWDNLGRVVAEYPHLETIARTRTTFRNPEKLARLRDDGRAGVLAGAHIANWELLPPAMLFQLELAMHPLYRAPNNPLVDRLLLRMRTFGGRLQAYDKSRRGLGGTLRMLESGGHVGMLIDQKMNTGIETLFFGAPAMTSTAFVELPKKLGCTLTPGRIIRLHGCRFEVEVCDDLAYEGRPTEDVIADMHRILEGWIREYPEQWLWIHRRWKDS